MKPNISVEFLRGLLFSYVAYQFFILFSGLFFSFSILTPQLWVGIIAVMALIGAYGAIGYALLFTPKGYARFVTIFLVVILLMHLFAVFFWNQYRIAGLPSPVNRALISQLVFGALFVGLAYAHQRFLKSRQQGGRDDGTANGSDSAG